MSTTHLLDGHGNPITGDADAVALYDRAIDRLLRFHPEVVELAGQLSAQPAPIPMAHALMGYLHIMSTEHADVATAREASEALLGATANEREHQHGRALAAWVDGDWHGSARYLDDLLLRWPTDLLAVSLAHQLAFFVGDAQNLRDRPGRALRELDPEHPHAPFVRGMVAFGLEESGHYGQALDAGLAAVAANPDDVWSIHAVAHVHEMQGSVDEGIRFMLGAQPGWASGNLFTVHNWWHLGLFHLEARQVDRALAIYDAEIHNDGSAKVPLELLDASAMLWRLRLEDLDTGSRFESLAGDWAPKAEQQPWYVFNDLHATMAFAGAQRLEEAHSLIKRLDGWLDSASGSNARMTAEIGLPACRAVVAFEEERYDDVIADLAPIRRVLQNFGGSHAQRDVLQRTLLEAALRAGRFELARALTAERLVVRETSTYSWAQRARALQGLDDAEGAAAATGRADDAATRFAIA